MTASHDHSTVRLRQRGEASTFLLVALVIAIGTSALLGYRLVQCSRQPRVVVAPPAPLTPQEQVRRDLYDALQPVKVATCELQRFGEPNDGGYLLCGNLLKDVAAAYSYGIAGYDGFGCQVAQAASTTVHQYDCFNTTVPVCKGGKTVFHGECVAGKTFKDEAGRPFDTVANQVARTAGTDGAVILKMDIEGAEVESLLATPDDLLRRVQQIAIEIHNVDQQTLAMVTKLKQHFHVANLHFNNYSCSSGFAPFPAWAYEVLFVNKAAVQVAEGAPLLPHPLDRPNNPNSPDCQPWLAQPAAAR